VPPSSSLSSIVGGAKKKEQVKLISFYLANEDEQRDL
jgi:hypothetical protein